MAAVLEVHPVNRKIKRRYYSSEAVAHVALMG
jgi:hypothetical protein